MAEICNTSAFVLWKIILGSDNMTTLILYHRTIKKKIKQTNKQQEKKTLYLSNKFSNKLMDSCLFPHPW